MKKILTFVFLCLSLASSAQILKKEWDIRYPQLGGMTVCDMMQTRNGQFVVLVGYVKNTEKSAVIARNEATEGAVVVADAATGGFLRKQTFRFRAQTANQFVRIVEALNKDWLIIGSSGMNEKARNGWVMRIKPDLEKPDNKPFGVGGDNFFEQVAQKNDGTWGLFGQINHKKGVLLVEYRKESLEMTPNLTRLGAILTAATDSVGQWHIAGKSDKDGLWWARAGEAEIAASNYDPDIKAADIGTDQKPYFFGTSWKNVDASIWIAKFNTEGWGVQGNKNKAKLTENIYGSKGQNVYFHAVAPNHDGQHYVVVSSTTQGSNGVARYKIVGFDGKKLNLNTPLSEDLGNSESFEITGLTQGFNNAFWVWGDMTDVDGATFSRLIKLQTTAQLPLSTTTRSKGDAAVVAKLFSVSHELSDETKTANNSLEPNENATLTLNLTNISGQNIPEISLKAKSATGGLTIEREVNAAKLKGNKAAIGFSISGQPNLISGNSTIIFELSVNGMVQEEIPVYVRCGGGGGDVQPRIIYDNNDLNRGERTITAPKADITVGIKIILPRPNADPRVILRKSGRAKDELPFTPQKDYPDLNDATQQIYPFDLALKLEQGENTFFVETTCEGFSKVDTIVILYNMKPKIHEPQRLHIIAIAPQYKDNPLLYNDDDVNDFVAKMQKQEGGLYKKVLPKVYVKDNETTAANIRKIFIDLVNRCAADYTGADAIGKRDVIVIFFSSHGKIIRGHFKIVPSDFDNRYERISVSTSVDYENDVLNNLKEIVDTTSEIARKVIVFIDACHSGGAKTGGKDADDLTISSQINALNAAASGVMTLSSTADSLKSYEDAAWQNGAFTEGLLEALDNKQVLLNDGKTFIQADTDKAGTAGFGYLSLNEIFIFLEKRVPDILSRHKDFRDLKQIPCLPKPEAGNTIPQLNNQLSVFKVN